MKIKYLSLLMFFISFLFSQSKIYGIVTDALTEKPLAAVNVSLDNMELQTKTDLSGKFEFNGLEPGKAMITFSAEGYESERIIIYILTDQSKNIPVELYKIDDLRKEESTIFKTKRFFTPAGSRDELLNSRYTASLSAFSIDDLLKPVAGVFTDRTFGIFNEADVTIRGQHSSAGRVLVNIDGIPQNTLAYGNFNWNEINTDEIGKIEILKGPASGIYGNFAMGGVVNLISEKAERSGLSGSAEALYGSLNTFTKKIKIKGKLSDNYGLSFVINAFNRTSDGYKFEREKFITAFSTDAALNETGFSSSIIYDFSDKSSFSLRYRLFTDERNSGYKNKFDNFFKNFSNKISSVLKTEFMGIGINISGFANLNRIESLDENYPRLINNSIYNYKENTTDLEDMGGELSLNFNFSGHNILLGGGAVLSSINNNELYKTFNENIVNKAQVMLVSAFLKDEFKLSSNIDVLLSIRMDNFDFSEASFTPGNVFKETNYLSDFTKTYMNKDIMVLSPAVMLKYNLSENSGFYMQYSQGNKFADLNSLTAVTTTPNSIIIPGEFPEPETIDAFEMGLNYQLFDNLSINASGYYQTCKNYLGIIKTGELILGNKVPVFMYDNIQSVTIAGIELAGKYNFNARFSLSANYTFTNAVIDEIIGTENTKDKYLPFIPSHMFNLTSVFLNEYVNFSFILHYQTAQFTDITNSVTDAAGNSLKIEPDLGIDIKIWKKLYHHFKLVIDIQNVIGHKENSVFRFNTPGRMIMAGLGLEF